MTHQEIRQKFLDFFKSKGHTIVPSSSLLPDDPSVLFTTAGMQQFKPYYVGKADPMKDFGSLSTASIQKCIRTSDIDEVGDERHLTFFEMLGNFSFGGYFKKEAIQYAHELITKEMGLAIDYVSVFGGEGDVPADTESEEIWKSLDPHIEVKKFGRADNFWGPTGDEGPCGPTTEIYVDGIEIWNVVFNQYYQHKDTHLELLKTPGIDTGMGLERLAKVVQKVPTVFETDLFQSLIALLPQHLDTPEQRIIVDHLRAIIFLINDGVQPSNKDQGYVLRRLMRRVIVYEHLSPTGKFNFEELFKKFIDQYDKFYQKLNLEVTIMEFNKEKTKFSKTLENGIKELRKFFDIKNKNFTVGKSKYPQYNVDSPSALGKVFFRFYESYGLFPEIIQEILNKNFGEGVIEAFNEEFKKHQEKSRAGAEKKFGGHGLLLDTGELKAANEEELAKVTRLHTATHLLQAALRKVLGDAVTQAGSDITAERLRFDFTFPRKMTEEEIREAERLVNEVVQQDLTVTKQTLPQAEAKKTGALHFFKIKYPDEVDVYSVGDFSKEFCGGPHVEHTGIIGTFKITKEEAVSAGVRRIRATVG